MEALKKKQIKKINIKVSDKKHEQPFSDHVGSFHLHYVERQLYKMGLSTKDKLSVIDKILQNLKEKESIQTLHSVSRQ